MLERLDKKKVMARWMGLEGNRDPDQVPLGVESSPYNDTSQKRWWVRR